MPSAIKPLRELAPKASAMVPFKGRNPFKAPSPLPIPRKRKFSQYDALDTGEIINKKPLIGTRELKALGIKYEEVTNAPYRVRVCERPISDHEAKLLAMEPHHHVTRRNKVQSTMAFNSGVRGLPNEIVTKIFMEVFRGEKQGENWSEILAGLLPDPVLYNMALLGYFEVQTFTLTSGSVNVMHPASPDFMQMHVWANMRHLKIELL
jgi:hypothetical protein